MTFEDRFKVLLAKWLREKKDIDAVEVTDYTDETHASGGWGCDTCGADYEVVYEVAVRYVNQENLRGTFYYQGNFPTLIDELSELEP